MLKASTDTAARAHPAEVDAVGRRIVTQAFELLESGRVRKRADAGEVPAWITVLVICRRGLSG